MRAIVFIFAATALALGGCGLSSVKPADVVDVRMAQQPSQSSNPVLATGKDRDRLEVGLGYNALRGWKSVMARFRSIFNLTEEKKHEAI